MERGDWNKLLQYEILLTCKIISDNIDQDEHLLRFNTCSQPRDFTVHFLCQRRAQYEIEIRTVQNDTPIMLVTAWCHTLATRFGSRLHSTPAVLRIWQICKWFRSAAKTTKKIIFVTTYFSQLSMLFRSSPAQNPPYSGKRNKMSNQVLFQIQTIKTAWRVEEEHTKSCSNVRHCNHVRRGQDHNEYDMDETEKHCVGIIRRPRCIPPPLHKWQYDMIVPSPVDADSPSTKPIQLSLPQSSIKGFEE